MITEERFFAYHDEKKSFQKSDRILVALSGGKDSVCLLFLLHGAKERFGIEIGACHVQHGIREDAEEDLLFCKELCERLSIPFYPERCDVPLFCKERKIGIEEGARMERYRLLREVAKREGYHLIATAHTASDQGETVLFRLIRGCGLKGAAGIPEKCGDLIRPLLPFSQEEILAYLEKNRILFTEDSTNRDMIYSRNRLRGRVLPELEEIAHGAGEALNRFARMAEAQNALVAKLCDMLEKAQGVDFRSSQAPISILSTLTETEGLPVLYEALSRMSENAKITIDSERFSALISLLKTPESGKIIEISDDFAFVLEFDTLRFRKNDFSREGIEYKGEIQFGENDLFPFHARLFLTEPKREKVANINKKGLILSFAFDKIEGSLTVKSFREGDRIQMNGMQKKVKKLLCDAHVPFSLRKELPILWDDKEILWIPFVGLCDKVRDENSQTVSTVSLYGPLPEEIEKTIYKAAANDATVNQ